MTFRSVLPASGKLRRILLSLALALPAAGVLAQAYPNKVIKLVVPYPPGGPTDTAARIIGEKVSQSLKQPVIVENRSGASGTIAAAAVAKSPSDGYTLMMLATPTLLAAHLYGSKDYDLFRDFAPVATVYDLPIVMVVNPTAMPDVTGLQQLIAKAKAQPGKLSYTSAGQGSFGHLTTELLKSSGQFEMQHVPYRGTSPAVADLLGGQVPIMFSDIVGVLPHVKSGKLRGIAVGSPQRVAALPDVKTVAEQGFAGFDAVSWGGVLAPAGTPKEIVARLTDEMKRALADSEVQKKLELAGAIARYQPPAEMASRMKQDFDKWGKVIRDNGIKAE